jgi:hypothetical protein
MLRDEALQPELASLAGRVRSYLALFEGTEEYPFRPACKQPGKIGLALWGDLVSISAR